MAGTWVGSLAQSLMARLRSFPAAALALDSVQAWWRKQAVRTAAVVAVTGVNAMIKPTARRKPELLLLSAFAVGAGLAWIRPWRILKRPSLLSTAIAQIASEAKR